MIDQCQAIRIFVRVAELGSFAGAAKHFNISAPAVTRAIAALETFLQIKLLVRSTRAVRVTEVGMQYLEDCRRILSDLSEADENARVAYSTPTGTLSVSASLLFGQMHMLSIINEYLDSYPAMKVRTVFCDRPVDMIEEGIDVAVRIGRLPDSGLFALKVGTVRHVICGSPAYFQKHGVPERPSDLRSHRVISSTSAWASTDWQFSNHPPVTVCSTVQCNTIEAAITLAKEGLGLTRALHYQVDGALASGDLQIVLGDYEGALIPVHILHPDGRKAPAKARTFVDIATRRLRERLLILGSALQ